MSQQAYSVRARLAFFRRVVEFLQGAEIGSILDLIDRIDKAQFLELVDAGRQFFQAEAWTGVEGRIAAAIRVAKIVAQFSESETDDQLLATLESILQNVGVLNAIAMQCETAVCGHPIAMTADDQAIYENAGFDLGRIIAIINLILELLRESK